MYKLFKKSGFILIAIGLISSFTYSLPIQGRIAHAIAAGVFKVKLPPPPPNRGIAGNRVGGASRISSKDPVNEGTNSHRHLTALVPEYRNFDRLDRSKFRQTKVWGLTASAHPTLWFYIPYAPGSISRIDFILTDGDNPANKTVYKKAIPSPEYPSIVNFTLPPSSTPLTINKLYQWQLKLTMDRQVDREISVTGWIQRSSLNSQSLDLIQQSSPQHQAAIYAENGFWYDALSTLAELRRDRPQDLAIQQDWKNILKSVDLGKLANKPFVTSY